MPLAHLHHRSGHGGLRGQAIQHPIVGQVAIPADFALFGGKTFPGKGLWQGRKWLLLAAIAGAFVGGAVDTDIDALTPDVGLAIEVINIAEADSCPEALF